MEKNKIKVALIIGHTPTLRGAYSKYLNNTEFGYFKKLLTEISNLLNFEFSIFEHSINQYSTRQLKMAENVRGFDLAMEFHFDKYSASTAKGCHAFYYKKNSLTRSLAVIFQHCMHDKMGIQSRSNKPVKANDKFNGSGFVLKMPCDAILLECFFGSNARDCEMFNENRDGFAAVLNEMVYYYKKQKETTS